jgi:hypothetical protein
VSKQERYLSSDPFSSRPASKAYRDNWELIFGRPETSEDLEPAEPPESIRTLRRAIAMKLIRPKFRGSR